MLILSRKTGESFELGEDIRISVLSIEGRRVRLAIQAPPEVAIVRSELVEAADANRDSAEPSPLQASELIEILHAVTPPREG